MTEPLRRDRIEVAEKDELTNDLINMLSDAGLTPDQMSAVLLQLVPYIVRRDHKVFNHGHQVGRASA